MNYSIPYIDKKTADNLISKAMIRTSSDSRGGNSKAYLIDDYCVLKTHNIALYYSEKDKLPFDSIIKKINGLKESDVHVVPVLGFYYDKINDYGDCAYAQGYIIQEKAKGSELYSDKYPKQYGEVSQENIDYLQNRVNELAHAPQEQYTKFIQDYKTICDAKIMIDPSKKSNFFYDKDYGFSFIDLNFSTDISEFDRPDLYDNNTHRNFIRYCFLPCVDFLSQNILDKMSPTELSLLTENNKQIFGKVYNGLREIGVSQNDIVTAFEEQKNYKSFSSEKKCFGVSTPEYFDTLEQKLTDKENTTQN